MVKVKCSIYITRETRENTGILEKVPRFSPTGYNLRKKNIIHVYTVHVNDDSQHLMLVRGRRWPVAGSI